MSKDVIQLLPDSVANQIAAGEVVQRPASVVKELLENAVDAGANKIDLIVRKAGKSIIQVVDNGRGMSSMDARMAFERHATSKILNADDLFRINTFGFRGEALPSIASVSEVEVKTKRDEDELGSHIIIAGSKVESQTPVQTTIGTNIIVKNLFFNVPARRKFLKSDNTEWRNIYNEFVRVAMTRPEIHFTLTHNDTELMNCPASGIRQRIVNIFGKTIDTKLINIECETEFLVIKGFVCDPEHSRKTYGEQFFFVNNRFMRHPFFHKAIMEAYEGIITKDCIPSYFLYFNLAPEFIDVNIHPTKTEIKFQNEGDCFKIILASVKQALGKFNIIPPIDFDTSGKYEYSEKIVDSKPYTPRISYKSGYNPFNYNTGISIEDSDFDKPQKVDLSNFIEIEQDKDEALLFSSVDDIVFGKDIIQIGGKYILSPGRGGLLIVHQERMHMRILFEKYMKVINEGDFGAKQQSLFPETIEFQSEDVFIIEDMQEELYSIGFELQEEGENKYSITSTPALFSYPICREILENLIKYYKDTEGDIKDKFKEYLAMSASKSESVPYCLLEKSEMKEMLDKLMSCDNYMYSPSGQKIIYMIPTDKISELINLLNL